VPNANVAQPTELRSTHPPAPELRLYAYQTALNERSDDDVGIHVGACPDCAFQLAVFQSTDPLLNGEDALQVGSLIRKTSLPAASKPAAALAKSGAF
jgi:hypothetical protein